MKIPELCVLTKQERINKDTFSSKEAIKKYSGFFSKAINDMEKSIIIDNFVKGGLTLDIGCGTGRTTNYLIKKGFPTIGIDYSEAMIKHAKKKFQKIEFVVMNACRMDFPDRNFDNALFSFNGLDCVYPYEKRILCLKEIYRVVKKNGVFAFSTHNSFSNKSFYSTTDRFGGKLILFSTNAEQQLKDLKEIGFKPRLINTDKDKHLYFVAEK